MQAESTRNTMTKARSRCTLRVNGVVYLNVCARASPVLFKYSVA